MKQGTDKILYIHGAGGSAAEAEHFRPLFPGHDVAGLAYSGSTPWEAGQQLHEAVTKLVAGCGRAILIANSSGAFFAMHAEIEAYVARAFFISPVVDMEKLIADRMGRAGITEPELRKRGVIPTGFGEDLSWEYLRYVRAHPARWSVPTEILYGGADALTSRDAVAAFAGAHHAGLTIMEEGEHWFHTPEQMRFLDRWITDKLAQ